MGGKEINNYKEQQTLSGGRTMKVFKILSMVALYFTLSITAILHDPQHKVGASKREIGEDATWNTLLSADAGAVYEPNANDPGWGDDRLQRGRNRAPVWKPGRGGWGDAPESESLSAETNVEEAAQEK